ncbi:protein BONZAI 1 [Nymphaea colorata]|nr:protein BONZAI 1 [Nymphaea colorata]
MTFEGFWGQLTTGFKYLAVSTLAFAVVGIFTQLFTFAFANIVYYSFNKFQIWRLLTSFLVDASILNVLFNAYILSTLLPELLDYIFESRQDIRFDIYDDDGKADQDDYIGTAIQRPTFVDYLRGGLQLNMMVAIDFTGSNGHPKAPTSLHYMNPNAPNQYQMAIHSIAQILMNYDSDKRIPAFGFGATTNFNGIKLPKALANVELSGPTYFGQLIEESCKLAANFKAEGSNTYTTLLIITDGEIHDMDRTVDLIVGASLLPLSIIIVGVGNANFDNMNRLDGDNGLYSSKGVAASRDIVQFVPFRDVQMSGDLLAKELLA